MSEPQERLISVDMSLADYAIVAGVLAAAWRDIKLSLQAKTSGAPVSATYAFLDHYRDALRRLHNALAEETNDEEMQKVWEWMREQFPDEPSMQLPPGISPKFWMKLPE